MRNPVHRDLVPDIAPNHELFWITDHLTGGRRLLDIVEFQIVRICMPDVSAATPGGQVAAGF